MRKADASQLDRVLGGVRDLFRGEVVGAYLFGSAVLGGLKPASDLDVLAVVQRPTTREQRQRLVAALLPMSGRKGRRHVELTLVVASEIRPWRYPPRMDFQYGDWLRGEFERGNLEPCPPEENPDLTTLLAMVQLGGRPLLGSPAAEVLDPVPAGDLRRGAADGDLRRAVSNVDALLEGLEDDTRNVLLTLARAWSTLETGQIRSKDAAADWAL